MMEFIDPHKVITVSNTQISSAELIAAAKATNFYIKNLVGLFNDIGFDIFYALGQRNISGFIGEIYKNILSNQIEALVPNPHPDGRPDILVLETDDIHKYYLSCFQTINGRAVPIKDMLTPFTYGGLEIKCSIGSAGKAQTQSFIKKYGHPFSLYESRAGYLNGITWWAHHNSATNLLGLYYDYYAPDNGIPQIIAAMYSELTCSDWNKVSTGDPAHKKTSNTSLNKKGLEKMKSNCLFYCSDSIYISQLKQLGIILS